MTDLEYIVNKYADDILRGCVHYLGNMEDAEKAFEDVFCTAYRKGLMTTKRDILPELLKITRKVCLADTIRDDDEASFLHNFYGLSTVQVRYILDRKCSYEAYKVAY